MTEYNAEERKILLNIARESIVYGLEKNTPMTILLNNFPQHLQQTRACFVTIHVNENLRGCIGTLNASQPLVINIAQNAFNAAFGDPRFKPLNSHEFAKISLDISVLSPPIPMQVASEADLLQKLRPGIDGLILSDHGHRATFLPSVWEQLPNSRDFVIHLKDKAGWPSNYWSNTMTVETYTTELIA